jgi:hypothetical protein
MNTLILLAENTLNPRGKPDDWFPGCFRYYSDFYRKGFALECEAMKKRVKKWGFST